MPRVYTEVDVDLDDFADDDLIEELERRGRGFEVESHTPAELVRVIYEKRRTGKCFEQEIDELIYIVIGKIV